MDRNIVLAGVGGQGILTMARAILRVALENGLHVKQAEVHGMSQRGGAVFSHLRISDREIFSELIPAGNANLILAVEPLEALRYAGMLSTGGIIVTNSRPIVNIEDYPAIEGLLDELTQLPDVVAFDMDRLARVAGSTLASNLVALGAASSAIGFKWADMVDAVGGLFPTKGERVRETNLRALRFGRKAAEIYANAIRIGKTPVEARAEIDGLSEADLELAEGAVPT